MAGNSFGTCFRVTTFGESHGIAIGGVVDGCPPGLALAATDLQIALDRRKPGTSRFTSQRREPDRITLLSGVFEGQTTGMPIAFLVNNCQANTKDYTKLQDVFRPGHADFTYQQKYGIRDYRGGGRASARETLARVAAGAIAQRYLSQRLGIIIRGCLLQLGDIVCPISDWSVVDTSPFFVANSQVIPKLEARIEALRRAGDSIGAKIYIEAEHVPAGLGEPVFAKLNADIASAMMGINAVKAVAIGDGFDCVTQLGSEHRDQITPNGFLSNHSGGILGGISTGQSIRVTLALKPASSIRIPGKTITTSGMATEIVVTGRHDPCVGLRAIPVAEAMLALVLMDHVMRQRAQVENCNV